MFVKTSIHAYHYPNSHFNI